MSFMKLLQKNTTANCITLFFLLIEISPLWSGRPFYQDWINHVWVLEYFSGYLDIHHTFPTTIDTAEDFGNPMPMFYGVFFYSMLSFPALVLGGDLTIRLAAMILLIVPVLTYFQVFKRLTNNHGMAVALSLIVNFSIYQLSNLYARGALTELAAYQSILLGLSLILLGFTADRGGVIAKIMAGTAFILFGFGTHPITLYMALLFFAPVVLCCVLIDPRLVDKSRLKLLFGLSALAIVLLLPWLVLSVSYQEHLHVFKAHSFGHKLIYFPQSIDSFWAKLGLFYTDLRIFNESLIMIETPFLDAPLPMLMLVMVLRLLWILRGINPASFRKMMVLLVFLMLVVLAMLIPPDNAVQVDWHNVRYVTKDHGLFYRLLLPIQFIYRFSGPISLCLLVILVTLVHLLSVAGYDGWQKPVMRRIAGLLVVLVILGALHKVALVYIEYHVVPAAVTAQSVEISEDQVNARSLVIPTDDYRALVKRTDRYPFSFYSKNGYVMYGALKPSDASEGEGLQVLPLPFSAFDAPMDVLCDRHCLIDTTIMPSLLYRVVIDGRAADHVTLSASDRLQFSLQPGPHRITVEWLESRAILLGWSQWGFIVFFVFSMGALALSLRANNAPAARH